ncbi:MAG: extracellular solute-binding protein, partial [Candidatus Promineifilaceae bacterium]|nr:extracellular solute-binding protein [Candidatus Promineifilaceae bacterium]
MKVHKIKSKLAVFLFFLSTLLLAACTTPPAEETPMDGRVLLWHDWQGADAQVLNDLIAEFTAIHPGVEVISVPISAGTIINRFQDRSDSGLGPDLMLLDSGTIFELAETGLIKDISAQVDLEKQSYLPSALSMLRNGDQLFGIPFSVHSQVLFYNKALVDSPPASLAELQARVMDGEQFAFDAQLVDVIWGLGAFGGSLFNSEGQLAPSPGGVINWLDFLQQAQALPGFILDTDTQRLRDLFVAGEAAYYVGPSSDLPALRAALGERAPLATAVDTTDEQPAEGEAPAAPSAAPPVPDTDILGVATLPVGPNEWQPGPILQSDAFVFSQVSSAHEQELALALVEFLTNPQQQTRLAAEGLGRIPASSEIRRNRNLPESTVALAKQIRTAIAIPYAVRSTWNEFVHERGEINTEYTRTLQGILSTSEFMEESAALVESQLGIETDEEDPSNYCPAQVRTETVSLSLWHALPAAEAEIMDEIAQDFAALCEGVSLELTAFAADEIIESYRAAAAEGGGPDILLGSSRWTSQLAEMGLLADLSDTVRAEDLEPLIPEAAVSMRYQNRLYGIPQSVSTLALLYNKEMVDIPPISLEELLIQIDPELRWALPMRFFYGYWGLYPFGGFQFDSATGLIAEQEGLVPWLTWLEAVQNRPGVDLTFDPAAATDAFARGEAAYLVGGPWVLPQLRQELGADGFGVAPLPSGPQGPGSPILQVEGIMVNANSEALLDEAVAFARFLGLPENQDLLLETGSSVSASVIANMEETPLLRGFQEQAKLASVVDENSKFAEMESLGNKLYEDVLLNDVDVETAVLE